jgi:hypothetical protein
MNVLCEGMDLSDIDFYNYDVPASSRSLYEDGYSDDLWTSIGDKPIHFDHMRSFIGDCWLSGVPLFELHVYDAFSTSKA